MRPTCKSCKHFREVRSPFVPYGAVCLRPEAQVFSHLYGPRPVRFDAPTDEGAKTLVDCDRSGWFEPKPRPWWAFWRAA